MWLSFKSSQPSLCSFSLLPDIMSSIKKLYTLSRAVTWQRDQLCPRRPVLMQQNVISDVLLRFRAFKKQVHQVVFIEEKFSGREWVIDFSILAKASATVWNEQNRILQLK